MSGCVDWLRDSKPDLLTFLRERTWVDPLGLGMVAFLSAALICVLDGIPLPVINDEFTYLLMGETFASGRLSNPTPPFWEHLEAFHTLMKPTYMGKYPPAQGIFLATGILLGHPILGVWISSALMVWGLTWMLQPLVGRKLALIGGGLVLVCLGGPHYWAQSYWGGCVAAAGGAIVVGALVRFWSEPRLRNSVLLGVGLLVLANSRPFEGLMVSLPVIGLVFAWAVGSRFDRRQKTALIAGLVPVLLGGALMMVTYNQAVTGSPFLMPYRAYQAEYVVAPDLLFGSPRSPFPSYRHQEFSDLWIGWDLQRFLFLTDPWQFFITRISSTVNLFARLVGPAALGLVFLKPVLKERWGKSVFLMALLGLLAFLLSKEQHPHYFAPALGPFVFLILLGWRQAWEVDRPRLKGARLTKVAATLVILVALVRVVAHLAIEDPIAQRRRAEFSACLDGLPFRSLVLVEYQGTPSHVGDWVWNGPDPFGSQVVWARSMGTEKDRLIEEGNPDRAVWRVPPGESRVDGEPRFAELVRFPLLGAGAPTGPMPVCR